MTFVMLVLAFALAGFLVGRWWFLAAPVLVSGGLAAISFLLATAARYPTAKGRLLPGAVLLAVAVVLDLLWLAVSFSPSLS